MNVFFINLLVIILAFTIAIYFIVRVLIPVIQAIKEMDELMREQRLRKKVLELQQDINNGKEGAVERLAKLIKEEIK